MKKLKQILCGLLALVIACTMIACDEDEGSFDNINDLFDDSYGDNDDERENNIKESNTKESDTNETEVKENGVKEVEGDPDCEHIWNQWKASVVATCTSGGERYRDCVSCGRVEVDKTPKSNNTHIFSNGKCKDCGATEEKPSEGLEYELTNNSTQYRVIGIGTCADEKVVIPSEYNGLPVTSIYGDSFYGCETIKSVVIPDSVSWIGSSVFERCTSLETVVLSNAQNDITKRMFYNCTSLVSVDIPYGINYIAPDAFYNCESLESITFPDSLTVIGSSAFESCESLTNIYISSSLNRIDTKAFYGTNLREINFKGTKAQFESIEKGTGWCNSSITIHCTDGDIVIED